MNKVLYLLFLSIFLFDFLSDIGLVSRYVTWFPDILSMLTVLIVFVRITVGYGRGFPPICSIFLILFFLNITIGIIINQVSAGPLIAGFRMYLKFIPFFVLPFFYNFSEEQVYKQLQLLFFLLIIQAPISLYQRLVVSKGLLTGDLVKGTFGTSGQLTIALTCAIGILIAFFLEKKIDFKSFITIFFLFFIPMTINETKSTLVFLPIACISPIFLSSSNIKLKQLIPLITLIILAGVLFVIIYDHFMRPRWGYGIIDFLFMENRIEGYMYKGSEAMSVGRVDSYIIAFKTHYKNILDLFFGLGIGNVSESFISGLSGEYADQYSAYNVDKTSLTLILWELGIFGVILYYSLVFMAFKYSRGLKRNINLLGTFANGWSVVSLIMVVSILYMNVMLDNRMGYLFWYFSGYIISGYFKEKYRNNENYF